MCTRWRRWWRSLRTALRGVWGGDGALILAQPHRWRYASEWTAAFYQLTKGQPMGLAEIIAREALTLPPQKQAEILDFIAFLKTRSGSLEPAHGLETADEIEAFFRSFRVDLSAYKFDRVDANAR